VWPFPVRIKKNLIFDPDRERSEGMPRQNTLYFEKRSPMKTIFIQIAKNFRSLTRAANLLSQAALLFMVISICYDVFMRYVMRAPTTWILEVNTFLVIFVCLIPAADLLQNQSHIRVTFLFDRLPPPVQKYLLYLNVLAGLSLCAVLTWQGFQMMRLAFKYGERMSTPLGTPYCIPYSFVPIGFGLLFIAYLFQGIHLYLHTTPTDDSGNAEPTTVI
jgi:TRAP-type C4-dicarboxylate transport system permease small subunit